MAGAVGRPVDRHGAWQPDGTISRVLLPVAITVELLVADGFARNIAGRNRLVFAPVPVCCPLIKTVLHGGTGRCGQQLGAAEAALLLAAQRERHTVAAVNNAAARLRHHPRGVAGRVDVQPVVAGLGNHEGQVGRVDLQPLAFKQGAYPQLDGALRQAQLGDAVVQRQKVQAGFLTHPHRG